MHRARVRRTDDDDPGSGGRRATRAAALALALVSAASARAGVPAFDAAPANGTIVAARAHDRVRLDGRLDEDAWRAATPFSAFVESFPRPGAPASFRTEVRVVFDDDTVWIGVACADPEPSAIVRALARRDGDPAADRIEVALAPAAGRLTAFHFVVNAAGVLRDQLLFADVNATDSWDAVWDAAVSVDDRGWTAELAIPFRQLRAPSAPDGGWGIVVRRHVPRTHQVFDSTPIPRDANHVRPGELVVSRLGRLEGLAGVRPRRGLELLPYAATRGTLRPRAADPLRPHPRTAEPALDLGLDLKLALTERLTLTGALHPDFGQVEADQVIQNLSTSEQFFPEKRPFFLEGLDVFQPVGSEYESPQWLFYSRRIGLDVPILSAAKVTGAARDGLEVGALAALVTRSQPLHLGDEPPRLAGPETTGYAAAVARQRLGAVRAGATFSAATPLDPRCAGAPPTGGPGCAQGANVLGVDLQLPGTWGGYAQAEVTQAVGGPPGGRILRDGTVLRSGDLGFGGHFRAGKLGGEPFRFDVTGVFMDPRLELNAIGFQPHSNYAWTDLNLHWVRPSGVGPFHSAQVDYNLDLNWSGDGRGLPRGVNTNVFSQVQLPGYQTVGLRVALELPQFDTREIAFAGVPFERTGATIVTLTLASDPNRALYAKTDLYVLRTIPRGPFAAATGEGTNLTAIWRPHARTETKLEAQYGHRPQGPRWVETLADGTAVFAAEDPRFFSVTLRQQLVFTPRLTLQLYAQLFGAAVRFGSDFRGATLDGRRHLSVPELSPVAYAGVAGAHDAVANVNAVLRWEYRPASTLFLVYTRNQRELPLADGARPAGGVAPSQLLAGPAVDALLVKWSWWWEP